jgi:hydroxymethylglutaryl-CoA synthase
LVEEKSVPSPDQDTITMSVEASKCALKRAGINPKEIGAVYIGSESHPYAVKPSGTVLAEAIGATPEVHTADFEFACKAGTEGMFVAYGLVKAGLIKYGLGVGADTSQGAPGDALEYTAAAGAAAYLFGREKIVAEVLETYSYTTDTPDFWRREYQYYPQHGGRFPPGLFQAHHRRRQGDHEQGRDEARRFPVCHFPPAKRQVSPQGRRDPGVH